MFFKRRTKNLHGTIAEAEAPWQNCIGVCSKCARKLKAMEGDKTRLRVALKALVAERGLKKKVRAVDVTCLDVCPENSITVAHFTRSSIRVMNVGGGAAPEAILQEFGY
ncbi:hypothetical protein Turpa_1440 [Turneriella parva DSM 21527]|uniref:(2Fe-2S) ferredoxin domain-containing protein n=2 Tax=Turneriella TaxID=338321 RepID=I4B481_TURPD|nr:hypothetical protein Turpa_1440 [Turneriella parva DSM 21527]